MVVCWGAQRPAEVADALLVQQNGLRLQSGKNNIRFAAGRAQCYWLAVSMLVHRVWTNFNAATQSH